MAIESAVGDGPSVAPVLPSHDGGGSVSVADAKILFLGDYSRQGHDLLIEHDGTTLLVQDYFAAQPPGTMFWTEIHGAISGLWGGVGATGTPHVPGKRYGEDLLP